MIKEAIIKLSKKEDLSYSEAQEVMNEVMDGKTSQVQTAAYLTALSLKGETTEEITGSAAGMRRHCVKLLHEMDVLEIVGTGGDKLLGCLCSRDVSGDKLAVGVSCLYALNALDDVF